LLKSPVELLEKWHRLPADESEKSAAGSRSHSFRTPPTPTTPSPPVAQKQRAALKNFAATQLGKKWPCIINGKKITDRPFLPR